MSALSNFFRLRDGAGRTPPLVRLIQRGETESALRLILAPLGQRATHESILEFLQFALYRGIDLTRTFGLFDGAKLVWAALPVVAPGRTMLVMTPPTPPRPAPLPPVIRVLDELCQTHAERGVHIAQVLLEPAAVALVELLGQARFSRLAELIYLHREVKRAPGVALPPGMMLQTYSSQNHSRFAHAVQRSYVGSLDCPPLNGRRDIEDILAGHRAGGDFDPAHWFVLIERDRPIAALLLAGIPAQRGMELVYLGLTPEARGRGVGDLLMRVALRTVLEARFEFLTLAVDAMNHPAIRLYERHGFRRLYSRLALLRDIRDERAPLPESSGQSTRASL